MIEERERIFQEAEELLLLRTVEAAKKAVSLYAAWLEKHPDDYVALDAGSHLSMLYDAILATEGHQDVQVNHKRHLVGVS